MRPRVAASVLLAALLFTTPAAAQRLGPEVKRPKLPAGADSNDASAYLALGTRTLDESPETASQAFYWAARLDPSSPDALYGRRVALLMRRTVLLKQFMAGGRRARQNKELLALDSLRVRANRLDPFLFLRFDRFLITAYFRTAAGIDFRGMGQGEIDQAIAVYLESAGPETRAWLFYSQGRFGEALADYDFAIKRHDTPDLHVDKARAYAIQSLNKPALEEMRIGLERLRQLDEADDEGVVYYSSKAWLEHGVGILQRRLGQPDSAKAAFGRALTEDLSYFMAHVELGRMALEAKDSLTAVSELGLAAEVASDEPYVQYLYGVALASTGSHAEAIPVLRKALTLEPMYAPPHFVLAQAYEKTGDTANAKTHYSAFLGRAARRDTNRNIASQRLAALGGAE